ncbi:response regulator transcription factor [Adlercreutzia sp. R25]|uniref:Heme response regulator HssR n=1 Tax=Adlercreutzia shanghongiae TaxID=3111773 RepID=A0ABU6IZG9_9ACTN|nr:MULTISPECIES: response regulator transcription factor [unclassified Adlercreutzia]MEC4273047.1 response regulator transcription factor [Adlercreutzia sp. R25]MEC4295163.1 response regulator transcription factor [Adlercreutzia sp. R22]
MAKILLADDERSLCDAVRMILEDAGYEVVTASDGREAVELFQREQPDLAMLDVMMPRLDGFEVVEEIRKIRRNVPVLILSAKGDIVDKKRGFQVGADDYVVKPFDDDEIVLRVGALLRRAAMTSNGADDEEPSAAEARQLMQPVTIGDLVIDPRRYEVTVAGKSVTLTPKEFQILALMADHPGEVFTNEELVETIWGKEYTGEAISIPVYIRRIRLKIEKDPSRPEYLQTVWRFGYKLGA